MAVAALHCVLYSNIFVEVTFEDSKENIHTHNTRETDIAVFTRLSERVITYYYVIGTSVLLPKQSRVQ